MTQEEFRVLCQGELWNIDNSDPAAPLKTKTVAYLAYQKYQSVYMNAKANYAAKAAAALADPVAANAWAAGASQAAQNDVDQAWDDWNSINPQRVEAALATLASIGANMQETQIAGAKKKFDAWSLGIAGVPVQIPYSYVDPTEWCDPTNDDIGFERLQIKRTSEDHVTASATASSGSNWWNNTTSSLSQSGHAGFASIGSASETTTNADQKTAKVDASQYQFSSWKMDHFTDFEVDMEWALVTIYRPWLISDIFYMGNWYIQGLRANAVSDGTITDQVATTAPLLPMIPQQMLVVRNVSIKSSSWGDTAKTLDAIYNGDAANTVATQDSQTATAGASLGPLNFGGSAKHASTGDTGKKTNYSNANNFSENTATFDGTTLSIQGTQLIAFVSDIVPACPAIDDPALPKSSTTSGPTIAGDPATTATAAS